MNIAIVENDPADAEQLHMLLAQYGAREKLSFSITDFHSGESFLNQFTPGYYTLIFLDIYMDGMDGAETGARIRAMDADCLLIFSTTSSEHMPEAFSCHAFDYIVKPLEEKRLFSVLDDVRRSLSDEELFFEYVSKRQTVRILYSDLAAAVSNGHYVDLIDRQRNISSVRLSFFAFCNLLNNDRRFLVINRGILVNMDCITGFSGNAFQLDGSLSFPIKVKESTRIKQVWLNYCFEKLRSGQRRSRKEK